MSTKIAGVSFGHPLELLLLVFEVLCLGVQYYVVVFLLGPIPFWAILLVTFASSRALIALYSSNSVHKQVLPRSPDAQYCRRCKDWISNRDHHCMFTGRCVEKSNYGYFISYVFYAYFLSTILVTSIATNYPLVL